MDIKCIHPHPWVYVLLFYCAALNQALLTLTQWLTSINSWQLTRSLMESTFIQMLWNCETRKLPLGSKTHPTKPSCHWFLLNRPCNLCRLVKTGPALKSQCGLNVICQKYRHKKRWSMAPSAGHIQSQSANRAGNKWIFYIHSLLH